MRLEIAALGAGLAMLGATAASAQIVLEPPVRLSADGTTIDTGADIGHAGPLFVDHDGDGLPDLLVSSFRGNIRFFKNVGTRQEPRFTEKEPLEAGGEPIRIHNW
jgi:hypothetical protein